MADGVTLNLLGKNWNNISFNAVFTGSSVAYNGRTYTYARLFIVDTHYFDPTVTSEEMNEGVNAFTTAFWKAVRADSLDPRYGLLSYYRDGSDSDWRPLSSTSRLVNGAKSAYMDDEDWLVPGKQYRFGVVLSTVESPTETGDGSYLFTWSKLLTNPEKPSKWDWNASNGSASDTQTKAAYKAVDEGRACSEFAHEVWNDLVDKVLELSRGQYWNSLDAASSAANSVWMNSGYGYSDDDVMISYSSTKMNTDTTMTAKRFNCLRHKLWLECGMEGVEFGTPKEVSTGDVVLGEYFLDIADKINAWVEAILE